ncbi:hypothetical protein GCM10010455_25780 [Microbacterium esteraromaticum]
MRRGPILPDDAVTGHPEMHPAIGIRRHPPSAPPCETHAADLTSAFGGRQVVEGCPIRRYPLRADSVHAARADR